MVVPNASLAHDLGEQYERLHEFELKKFSNPDTGVEGLVAVVPVGKKLESVKKYLDEYLDHPERRRGTATLRDADSFIAHVMRFSRGIGGSAIFANPIPSSPSFLAILDYHPASPEPTEADWLEHRAIYNCPLSDEWKAWTANNGKPLSQGDFAAFLEDRIQDVVPANGFEELERFAQMVAGRFATPNQLIELSRGLAVNVESTVKEAVTLSSGEIDIKYTEQHTDDRGRPIKVPNLFAITIPVFYAGHLYRIPVRLRYRVQGGRVVWSYHLARIDRVFDDAFKILVEQVKQETGLPVFLGAPEN